MLPPDCAPSSIPDDAEEVLEETTKHEHVSSEPSFSCRVNGEIVGKRARTTDGQLVHEMGWRGDRPHGWFRRWDEPDVLTWETFMVDGREHGVARQWDGERLIGWYVMDRGTGVDLWRNDDGSLSEGRHFKGGRWHGFVRWWEHESNARIWWEEHFHESLQHGIERQWNGEHRLRRGYPRYFVNGERVTKRQYLRAAAKDPTLPPFRPEDNRPERPLPPEYVETMPPAVPPRMSANPEEWKP